MMNKKKLITMIFAVSLVAVVGVGATLAYFTDTEDADNVVVMGNVNIALTEGSGEGITNEGMEFGDVLPGQTVDKNPTITIEPGSADAYVRAKVSYDNADSTITAEQITDITNSVKAEIAKNTKWYFNESDGYFYYADSLTTGDSAILFNQLTVPTTWDNATANQTFHVLINAEAIQADYSTDVIVKSGASVTDWNITDAEIQNLD